MVSLLLTCVTTWLSLLAVWCVIGATPRGQPWTPAVARPHVRDGLSVRRIAMWCPFSMPSMYRHVHHQFVRNRLHNCTTIVPVTIYHQGSYVETYRRAKSQASIHGIDGEVQDAEPGAERACATALGSDRSARAGARWRQCRGAGNRTIAPNNLRRHRGDPHRHSEQNPQSARRNNVSGEQISRWFLLLSENLSASNYPGAASGDASGRPRASPTAGGRAQEAHYTRPDAAARFGSLGRAHAPRRPAITAALDVQECPQARGRTHNAGAPG